MLPSGGEVCIVHHTGTAPALHQALQALPRIRLISHPLELAGIAEHCPALFANAKVSWLDWPELHRPQSGLPAARLVVYNNALLPEPLQASLARQQARLHPGDISADLIEGLVLALGNPQASAEVTPEMH